MTIKKLIAYFLILLPWKVIGSYDAEPYFTNISVRDGLPHVNVYCIHEDKQGLMWFGTGDGLSCYNGDELKSFTHVPQDSLSISNNRIHCIAEDGNGCLWIGTNSGLNKYDPDKQKFYRHMGNNIIRSLCIDSSQRLWIATDGAIYLYNLKTETLSSHTLDGFIKADMRIQHILEDGTGFIWATIQNHGAVRINPQTLQYKLFLHDPMDIHSIRSNSLSVLFLDSKKCVWVGTQWRQGLSRYDYKHDYFTTMKLKEDHKLNSWRFRSMSEDKEGNLWLGTHEGLIILNPENGDYKVLHHNNKTGSLSHNSVISIFKDSTGTMWLGTYGGGVNLYNPVLGQFKLHETLKETSRNMGHIGPLLEYNDKIWIGSEGEGLDCFDPKFKSYQHYDIRIKGRPINAIRDLHIDSDGLLWIGTGTMGLMAVNIRDKAFPKQPIRFRKMNSINDITEDSHGNIWVGTNQNNGLYLKRANSDDFEPLHKSGIAADTINYQWIRVISELSNGEMWVGSMQYGIFVMRDGKFQRRISSSNTELSCDYISVIWEDSHHRIWIGTHGGGVNIYDPTTKSFQHISTENGLPNNNICSIIEYNDSNYWISTMGGLSCYNPKNNSLINFSYRRGNFPIEILSLKSGLQVLSSKGQIYIGGNNAFVSFDPSKITYNTIPPKIIITELSLHNKTVLPLDATGILKKSIQLTKEISLKHNQTDITLQFAALNYIYPQNNQYSYILEGYDKEWTEPKYRHYATYTNLPSGTYRFRIRASNDSGVWNTEGITLTIHVLPAPWTTWWAWCLYIIFTLGVIYMIIRHYTMKIKLKHDIVLKQMEKQTLEKNHQMSINLFTNFSHELRTPLTLILDPLKNILADKTLPEKFKKPLEIINQSALKMLELVNQLMDLKKQESGQMQLKVKRDDIVKFIQEITIIFREMAQAHNINMNFNTSNNKLMMYFDPFLMEKVFFNILSNAMKYTPDNGFVNISITTTEECPKNARDKIPEASSYVHIKIQDNGPGIPQDDIERIFDPFFQVISESGMRANGTGIGLSLSKSIVTLHHGIIWAESQIKQGSIFNVVLPIDNTLYSPEDIISDKHNHTPQQEALVENITKTISPSSSSQRNRALILVVEDNADIRAYINNHLNDQYIVYEAENGEVGLKMAKNVLPDLIISDIMMPIKDGLELSRELKTDQKTSHIPIILLTARTSIHQIKEGLGLGAEDYITKPFNIELLKAKVDTLITNRKHIKEALMKNFKIDIPLKDISKKDELFLSQAYDFVRENIDNSGLNIDHFSHFMQLERTQLYRKFKALTGMPPSVFILTIRLKVAAELLVTTRLSISEIAYKVGFDTPSYFATCFKRQYGISPTEYILAQQAAKSSKGKQS